MRQPCNGICASPYPILHLEYIIPHEKTPVFTWERNTGVRKMLPTRFTSGERAIKEVSSSCVYSQHLFSVNLTINAPTT